MSTTIQLKATAGAVIDSTQVNTHITPGATWQAVYEQNLLLQFEQPSSSYQYKKIEGATFWAYLSTAGGGIPFEIKESFDASTVTWNTQPSSNKDESLNAPSSYFELNRSGWNSISFYWQFPLSNFHIPETIQHGILLKPSFSAHDGIVYTSAASSTYRPYIEVEFSADDIYIEPSGNIINGYVNPHKDLTLKWSNVRSGYSMEKPTQESAAFTWKETGGAENTTSLTTEQAITIPADTWSAGTSYQWKVDVTDNLGHTTTSGWYTLSTTAAAATPPTLEFPVTDVVDGTGDVTFRWVNNGGENNTGTDLEFSTDGTTWGSPINVAAGVAEYTVAAGTLPSGTNYWRARAYNADSTAGSWTDATIFTVISSPLTPYFEVTNTPRPTITWVSDEQQAFQVQMGGYDSGLVFGTAQSFKCPVYLPNGTATVRVRVMNQYNLWSDWSGTQITIANTPGSTTPPWLSVATGTDAQLSWLETYTTSDITSSTWDVGKTISATGGLASDSHYCRSAYVNISSAVYLKYTGPATGTGGAAYWPMVAFYNGSTFLSRLNFGDYPDNRVPVPENTTRFRLLMGYNTAVTATADDYANWSGVRLLTPETGAYLVYRDGELIAETDGTSFTDRYANGQTSYFIRQALAGDNYAQSNTVSVELSVPCPMITAIDGNWIELQYSTEPIYSAQNTHTQQVSMMVYSGSVYPVPEIAPHRQRSYQIAVAFRRGESGPFEQLLGRECFLKDQYGAAIHGVISAIATAHNRWYTVCSATLEEMEGSL